MKNADIKQLELMCELIETQSLSEAAARLGMTPSAASQSLSRLRATFGEEVYVRQGNAYRLTPHGEQVMGGVRAIVRHWNEALQASGDFDPSTCELRFAVACVAHTASPDLVRLHADMRRLALGRRFAGLIAWDSFFHLRPQDQRAMFPIFAAHAAPAPRTARPRP